MKRITETVVPLSAAELCKWRDGYQRYLELKGLTPDQAADMAAKVTYRPNLYPTDSATALPLFQLTTPPDTLSTTAQPGISLLTDCGPAEGKPNDRLITSREERRIKISAEIIGERPDDDDRGYMHSIMCQVGLPRSKVDSSSFERHSGGAALLVEAGKLWDGKGFVQQPIPYGPMPRLMLAWMNTYAVRFNTPEIPVGDSASDFMRMLGKTPNGGRNSAYATFRKQIQALSACRITLGFNANGRAHTYEGKPIKHFEAWLSSTEQRPLWPGMVTFSDDYYQTLKSYAVPLDLRAFMELKGSALAMDVYTWLAQRLHRIEGRPIILHWATLREQFGQEYQGKNPDKDFKKKFLHALRAALAVYPQARVRQVTGGLLLMPSPPPIPFKGA